jgi:hypothetical protein
MSNSSGRIAPESGARSSVSTPRSSPASKKHTASETLPIKVRWTDEGGLLDWDVTRIAECDRSAEPDDVVSFDMVHECSDTIEQGQKIGFRCNRDLSGELLAKCPWFRRR